MMNALPDHALWSELENYFRVQIGPNEKHLIVDTVQQAMQLDPNVDLDELTLKVTHAVLNRRKRA